ncbi:MAG: nucleotidyltransferase domain-containing protein [archaeon]
MDILTYFIKEPEREFHVRELAKLTKKSPTTVSKYLKQLEKENILISEKKLNHLFFKANSENPSFKDQKLFYNIKTIRDSGLIEHLHNTYDPEAIILFGSFAKAENIERSDIDILIITPSKKEVKLEKFEKKLNHKIQLFLHSKTDLQTMKNKKLLNNFINGIKLEGYWELFK